MNHKRALRLIVILFFIGIMTTGAFLAIARTNFTSACETCHNDTTTLSISSNATGTVTAKWTVPFILVVDTDGYTGGDNQFVISLQNDWADNNEFTFTPAIVADGSAGDTNPTTNEIQTSLSFTPDSMGSFTIRIYSASAGDKCAILDVSVDVIHWDIVAPTIDSPDDSLVLEGDPSANVTWTPIETNPDRYEVLDGAAELESGTWDGSPVEVMLNTLTLGTHTLTVTVWDIADSSVSDVVDVTVYDGTAPVVPDIIDFSIPEGDTGNFIVWNPYDIHPASYEIYENSTLLRTGLWNSSSEDISASIDGYALGEVNYTLVVYDDEGMSTSDTVIITIIDGTPPIVDHPEDIAYLENSPDYEIIWTFSDLHPVSYEVYKEETLIQSGTWNLTIDSITIDVGGQAAGTYNYTLVLVDTGGNIVSDDVQVLSFSAVIPIIFVHPDVDVSEGTLGVEIIWKPIDLNPNSYIVFKDGYPIQYGLWNDSSEVITVSLDGLDIGVYNYTLIVIDDDTHTASDEVWVTVYDGTPPVMSPVSDINYIEGDLGSYVIDWEPFDSNPQYYQIFLNDVLYLEGQWNSSSEVFSIDVGNMLMGTYNYTLLVNDIGANLIADSVIVNITDETAPIFINPGQVSISDGSLGNSITWSITEVHPDTYELYIDGILTRTGIWNSSLETFTLAVDGLMLGIYNYTMIVSDASNNEANGTVLVYVIDDSSPILNSPADIHYTYSDTGNTISWEISDLHLASYEIYKNDALYLTGEILEDATLLEIDVDGLNAGSHNITAVIYDSSGNVASDSVWVSVLPLISSTGIETEESEESTDIDNSTEFETDVPMQFIPEISEEIIAIFSGWLIGGVAVLSVFWFSSRPKK